MSKEERIKAVLNGMTDKQIIDVYNEYCFRNSYYDEEFIPMYEFDSQCAGMTPTKIAEYVMGADFDTSDDFYMDTIYGPVSYSEKKSADEIRLIRLDDLVKHIIGNDDSLDTREIGEILDGDEEEED